MCFVGLPGSLHKLASRLVFYDISTLYMSLLSILFAFAVAFYSGLFLCLL